MPSQADVAPTPWSWCGGRRAAHPREGEDERTRRPNGLAKEGEEHLNPPRWACRDNGGRRRPER